MFPVGTDIHIYIYIIRVGLRFILLSISPRLINIIIIIITIILLFFLLLMLLLRTIIFIILLIIILPIILLNLLFVLNIVSPSDCYDVFSLFALLLFVFFFVWLLPPPPPLLLLIRRPLWDKRRCEIVPLRSEGSSSCYIRAKVSALDPGIR